MNLHTRRVIYGDPDLPAYDVWADIPMGHLSPSLRREASDAKKTIICQQQGRTIMRAPYETGTTEVRSYFIDTLRGFHEFLDKAHSLANEKPTVVTGLNELKLRRPAKDILNRYADIWPSDRKEKLISRLAHNGYFRDVPTKSSTSSAFQAMSQMRIKRLSVNFLLQMDVQHTHLAAYVAGLFKSARSDIEGLARYLELPLEDRKIQLELCEFCN